MSQQRAIRILVIAVILFTAYAGWTLHRNRQARDLRICREQLADLDGAKEQYAIEHDGHAPSEAAALIPAYLSAMPACPAGGVYTLGDMQTQAMCSVVGHTP